MKTFIWCFTLIVLAASGDSFAINLGDYFPQSRVSYYADANGTLTARYGFEKYNSALQRAFKFNSRGIIGSWSKDYFNGSYYQHVVVQPIYFGRNQSVIELGGLKSEGKVTYKNGDTPTGLYWSAPGGLSYGFRTKQMDVYVNGNHGDLKAYSRTRMIEWLPSYTLEHGNQQTYQDVIHLVFYHGTKTHANQTVRCFGRPLLTQGAIQYLPMKGYNSYAIELWLARGIGIIKEAIPFTESKEASPGVHDCSGYMFDGGESWTNYLIN